MTTKNLINFKSLGDARGDLVALESERNIPFHVKRVYYLFGTNSGESRGYHAHKKLRQVAICVAGKCRMVLDDGKIRDEFWLSQPTVGIMIDQLVWHEMHDFSDDCVLLVLADDYYDESDYVRDYDNFIKQVSF
ncbi:dTDP-6-deoxy-3,4-keto-hexulose isomerase [Pseudidiomarina atlantica]|uniref:dTDP-6-deoxy-3,4-keto-hexulose isomerase n=1 Tax=Pseudidiomarina atlantica TaxID=1517416 RepID=A0A094ITQ0_9GAMM|nr:FdtA/QdtA family cupin domain-containing protein [Pseudidiomarina atlantica]KFZ29204.1 dTDP-6-deoxy-3,4-keto-hexulose isomerase [Pseudidiomarina atlantica]